MPRPDPPTPIPIPAELAPEIESSNPSPSPAPDDAPAQPQPKAAGRRRRGVLDAQDVVPTTAVARRAPTRVDSALDHARLCARIAEDNRARDVLLLDLRGATALVDFFVIATAGTRRQASSIAFEIDAEMKKLGERKLGIEGAEEGRWVLLDYADFVVHVFSEDVRTYYALEEIWGDAPQLSFRDRPADAG
ncbi:MAG TPA: ribosome silencing factor [Isosphaeraceae bacterium]|jgi:ribosome-associated protein|nr:ribosome silencing factor [Isosphaeraceae bacterium]